MSDGHSNPNLPTSDIAIPYRAVSRRSKRMTPMAPSHTPTPTVRATALRDRSQRLSARDRRRRRAARILAVLSAAALLAPAVVNEVTSPAAAATTTRTVELTASSGGWTTTRAPQTAKSNAYWLSTTYAADAGYLTFPTASLPDSAKITSATLSLSIRSTKATKGGVLVYPAATSWSPKTLTHANRPARLGGAVSTSTVKAVAGRTISIPLATSGALSTKAATSFELRYSQPAVGTLINLRSAPPKLTITYTTTSATPGPTPTPTPTPTATATSTPTPTVTPTATPTPKPTATATPRPTPTATPTPTPTPTPTATTPPSSGSDELPFAVPAVGASTKKVFAHYFPPYPVSFDNLSPDSDYYARNYLTVGGENGKHAAYSGLLRDRPETRAPLSGDWRTKDFNAEIDDAAAAGVDGFMVDVLSLSGGNWDRTVGLTNAAAGRSDGFTVIPNIDATSSVANASPATVAAAIAPLMKSKAAYKLPDGRVLLSSFKAEGKSASWWKDIMASLKNTHGISAAFVAVFLDSSEANLRAFAPFTYAASNWGKRSPDSAEAATDRTDLAHALGMKWIEPIAVQDVRHKSGVYAEAANTETLRATWKRAISNDADFAQLITWNDYSEATSFAASEMHGSAFLDLSAYYASWFKTGKAPSLRGDEIIVTHRTQSYKAAALLPPVTLSATLGGNITAPRDTVEVVTMLTAPATVTLRVGSATHTIDAPAGLSAHTVPLRTGKVSASAARGGQVFATATTDDPVVSSPDIVNLLYAAATSRD